jgi:hypothetical protein
MGHGRRWRARTLAATGRGVGRPDAGRGRTELQIATTVFVLVYSCSRFSCLEFSDEATAREMEAADSGERWCVVTGGRG